MVMGTDYWLVLKPANVNVSVAVNWMQSLATAGSVKASFDDSTWVDNGEPILPAFRITAQGAAVPDGSSTSALLAIAIAVMFGLNLLQRKLVRMDNVAATFAVCVHNPTPAVACDSAAIGARDTQQIT